MNIDDVKALAGILIQNELTSIEVSEGETKIKLEKTVPVKEIKPASSFELMGQNEIPALTDADHQAVDFNKLVEVKSPIVGIFYSAPSPEADPFVTIGSKVKKGDILCIIEAMKLMNEITAEVDGEIVDICVKNGDIAEYGQVLFRIF